MMLTVNISSDESFQLSSQTHGKHTVFHLVLQGNSQKRGQGRGLFFGLSVPRVAALTPLTSRV